MFRRQGDELPTDLECACPRRIEQHDVGLLARDSRAEPPSEIPLSHANVTEPALRCRTRETVERIAKLAALRLSGEEFGALGADLAATLDYVEQLSGVDTEGVEPTSHVIPMATPLREDRPGTSSPPETAIANAPSRDGSAFAVPKVLEGEDEG